MEEYRLKIALEMAEIKLLRMERERRTWKWLTTGLLSTVIYLLTTR